uniref:DUF4587 domain-containing protein n=1 Tax=Stegastes partitus TaxID=144197 RepID=A0A3B5B337_9TELE
MLEDLNRLHTRGGSLTQQYQSRFITPPQLPPPPAPMAPTHIYRPANSPSFLSPSLPMYAIWVFLYLHVSICIFFVSDMVELMLMQNAQMHQIIMHNMMLRAMPPMALSPPGGSHHCAPHSTYLEQVNTNTLPHLCFQDSYQGSPLYVRPDVKTGGSAVHHHHHHHYGLNPTAPQLPPISCVTWPPEVSSVPAGLTGGQIPSLHQTAPVTLPPL